MACSVIGFELPTANGANDESGAIVSPMQTISPLHSHAIDNSTVLVKYTYYGDSDFNGIVDFNDYPRTDGGFSCGGLRRGAIVPKKRSGPNPHVVAQ